MAGITLSGITKSYGAQTVINGIDLEILDGEFLTLVGPSGCGKINYSKNNSGFGKAI